MLGHVLRLLVEPEKVADTRPRRLVRGTAVLGPVQADRPDGARVDDPLDPGGLGRVDHVQAAADVDVVEVRRVRRPEPVHGGDVEDHAAPDGGGRDARGVAQVRHNGLNGEAIEVVTRHAGLEQGDDLGTACQKRPGDTRANEAGRARDEHPVARSDGRQRMRSRAAEPGRAQEGSRRSALLARVRPNSNRSAELRWASSSTSSSASTK